jgi:hypothetical protein
MKYSSLEHQPTPKDVGVYECEIHLKFRLVEEQGALNNQDQQQLLEILMDAFAAGADEYLEPLQVEVKAKQISEVLASPQMRRQLMRLRNSQELA